MAKSLALLVLLAIVLSVNGHGRFMKPVGRSSIWRVPEFSHLSPPRNEMDNEILCGYRPQPTNPGDDCGVCGDPFSSPAPRDNEIGGRWYRGIIVANYTAGQVIDVEIELTAAHLGFMEWRLCSNTATENQACFNSNLLQLANGSGSMLPVTNGSGWYRTQVRLPSGLRCNHCIIQWNYRAGNSWGNCPNGSGQTGCGPQETFRGCADVRIN